MAILKDDRRSVNRPKQGESNIDRFPGSKNTAASVVNAPHARDRLCADGVVVDDTRRWLQRAVIGLNLCPFAKAVDVKGQVHYAVSRSVGFNDLLADFRQELFALQALESIVRDTTLFIAPDALADFLEFNDFLAQANRLVAKTGLSGVFQIASLHPQYVFADAPADAVSNFTNRAPYPTLHILREASVEKAVKAFPDASAIFDANMRTMEQIGVQGWTALGVGASDGTMGETP